MRLNHYKQVDQLAKMNEYKVLAIADDKFLAIDLIQDKYCVVHFIVKSNDDFVIDITNPPICYDDKEVAFNIFNREIEGDLL